jgi:hypothetical protein
MKKYFLILTLLSLSGISWASSEADSACYHFVASQLEKNSRFNRVLLKAWRANLKVDIQCENRGRGLGALDPNLKKGDRVVTGWVDADVKVQVQPLDLRGGTLEKVSVKGQYGYSWDVEDSDFFDVEKLSYEKERLPQPAREER